MNFFKYIDESIFFFFNHQVHVSFLNDLMPYWRSPYFWLPLYVFFIAFMLMNFGKKGAFLLLALGLTVGTADFTSSKIIKPLVKRYRPCRNEVLKDHVKLLVPCGVGFSFPSSHASNHFAIACFLTLALPLLSRRLLIGLWLWAASIALGQVYVGVHYPSDIMFGAFLGCGIAYIGAKIYKKVLPAYIITASITPL